jgi:hypothetical protein
LLGERPSDLPAAPVSSVVTIVPAAPGSPVAPATNAAPAAPAEPNSILPVYKSTNSQTYLQTHEYDKILALLIFVSFYAVLSTFFLCFYCMGFSCGNKTKSISSVANASPVSSDVIETLYSPLSTVCSPSSTVLSQSESCLSEYPSSSSTYGPSFLTVSNVLNSDKCESYV